MSVLFRKQLKPCKLSCISRWEILRKSDLWERKQVRNKGNVGTCIGKNPVTDWVWKRGDSLKLKTAWKPGRLFHFLIVFIDLHWWFTKNNCARCLRPLLCWGLHCYFKCEKAQMKKPGTVRLSHSPNQNHVHNTLGGAWKHSSQPSPCCDPLRQFIMLWWAPIMNHFTAAS